MWTGFPPAETRATASHPLREAEPLNAVPAPACDEAQFDAHCEENGALMDALFAHALEGGGEWVVRSSFLDEANAGREPVFEFAGSASAFGLPDRCDVKNGVDVMPGFLMPRAPTQTSLFSFGLPYRQDLGHWGVDQEARRWSARLLSSLPQARQTSLLYVPFVPPPVGRAIDE